MAYSVKQRQNVERRICRALIKEAIALGYYVSVDNGEEVVLKKSQDCTAILKEMFSVDEEHLRFHTKNEDDSFESRGWVFLVYGNDGWDVIADYTIGERSNCEVFMTEANKLSDLIQDSYFQ